RFRAGGDHSDGGRSRPPDGSGYRLLAVRMLLHQWADLAGLLSCLPAAAGFLLDYPGHGAGRPGARTLELCAGDRRLLCHWLADADPRSERLDAQMHGPAANADGDGDGGGSVSAVRP